MCKLYLHLRNWLNESLPYPEIITENWKENWEMRSSKFAAMIVTAAEKSAEVFFGINDWQHSHSDLINVIFENSPKKIRALID